MKIDPQSAGQAADIVSDPVVYPGRSGLKISAFWDHARSGFERFPFVVMAPKYSETKKNNLQLAYFLAANGMNVIRFDHTCHVGESAGVGATFTLPGAVDDIKATVDYLAAHHGVDAVGLVGSSLSARTALRAAAEDSRIAFLVCIVGVVNFRESLREVYREDVVGSYLDGRKWGVNDVLGYTVDFDHFIDALLAANMHDLAGSVEDARRLRIPAVFFPAVHDTWVGLEEVRSVAEAAPLGRVEEVEGAMHEVRESAEVAEGMFRRIVAVCLEFAYGASVPPGEVAVPRREALLRQNRVERMRLRRASDVSRDENAFWSDYLRKFDYIKEGRAYRAYLDLLVDLVAPIRPGEVFLDAGCGNGTLGLWVQRHLGRGEEGSGAPPVWLSVDLTSSGLEAAMNGQVVAAVNPPAAGRPGSTIDGMFMRSNLDAAAAGHGAAFAWLGDASVDCAVASLLVSYLEHPQKLLFALSRVVRPGGRIVVSSMKPHCDMSGIYRDFVSEGVTGQRLDPARNLLAAAGAIRIKEEVGIYRFYSAEELTEMLTRAGFHRCAAFRAFEDQAVVVRALK